MVQIRSTSVRRTPTSVNTPKLGDVPKAAAAPPPPPAVNPPAVGLVVVGVTAAAEAAEDADDDRDGVGREALSWRSSSLDSRLSSPAFLPESGGGGVRCCQKEIKKRGGLLRGEMAERCCRSQCLLFRTLGLMKQASAVAGGAK